MASLYRKCKKLEFDDGESITVRELEVSTLLKAQHGEVELSDDVLIKECTGLNKEDLSIEAYNKIVSAIDELHADTFENKTDSKDEESPKKKSLNS